MESPKVQKVGHWLSKMENIPMFYAVSVSYISRFAGLLSSADFFYYRIQWIFQVPVKGGIGGIVHPPIGRKNTTYIPLIVLAF